MVNASFWSLFNLFQSCYLPVDKKQKLAFTVDGFYRCYASRYQPFTAPEVRPRTNCLDIHKNRITIGNEQIRMPDSITT